MPSLIESGLDQIVNRAFTGMSYAGTLRKEVATAVDSKGNLVSPTVTTYTFNGIREDFDAVYAARADIPTTDVKVLIIARSLPNGIAPAQGDKVFIRGQWHQIRRILSIDPANATFSLQCYALPQFTG